MKRKREANLESLEHIHRRFRCARFRRRLRFLSQRYQSAIHTELCRLLRKTVREVRKREAARKKKLKREHDKLLRTPSAGTSVKGRDGSTRHGYVISVSKHWSPTLTVEEVLHRNALLEVNEGMCFWCKRKPKEDLDHAVPCCSTKTSTYSWTNAMNIFPSCKKCNSTKSGNAVHEWVHTLVESGLWTERQRETFVTWLEKNRAKLIMGPEDTAHVEKQFPLIQSFHKIAEWCAEHKCNLEDYVTIIEPDVESV